MKTTNIVVTAACYYNMHGSYWPLNNTYSFIVGHTGKEILTQDIRDLPHLLIAGSTGGGKSNYMRNIVLGVLSGSSKIQICILDLKRGVEAAMFKGFDNIHIAKTEMEATHMLAAVEAELQDRLKLMEREEITAIEPGKHQKDMILVFVDEASVLYNPHSGSKDSSRLSQKARDLTDSIAKLGRATAIHLVLATQKVTKQTIDTRIQENIVGRMCFRMATLSGSNIVLANKLANELGSCKGRGIWKNNDDCLEVQTPLVTEDFAESKIKELQVKFKSLYSTRKNAFDWLRHGSVSTEKGKKL